MTITPDFIDLRTRAEFLDLCGEREQAEELRQLSMSIAREVDLTCYAYQLLWRGRHDEALSLLQLNAEMHPDSWNIFDTVGEIYSELGDVERAIEQYSHAAALVPDPEHADRIGRILGELFERRAAHSERRAG